MKLLSSSYQQLVLLLVVFFCLHSHAVNAQVFNHARTLQIAANSSTAASAKQDAKKAVKEAEEKKAEQPSKEEEPAQQAETQQPAGPTFDIYEFRVVGNTKLTEKEIGRVVYPLMGEKKTIEDVENAKQALEKAYHQAGYLTVFVDIPEQDVDNKIVQLKVTEGKVSKLRVSGSRYYSLGRIKALSTTVKEGEVPHFPTLQKQMTTLNRTADKRVTPVIKAGRVFGTVDVDLKVEDQFPLHGSLELNDQYSNNTSRTRLNGTLRYDNLFQRDHSLLVGFITAPEKTSEVQGFFGRYTMRFDESDWSLGFNATLNKSDQAVIGGINVLGDATIFGVSANRALPSLDNYFHSIYFGLEYKNFEQKLTFGDDNEDDSPITYIPITASYVGTLQSKKAITQLILGSTLNLRGLGTDDEEFEARRSGANPNFFVSTLELNHTHVLPKSFEAYIQLNGQYSESKLISNEQYFAGGLNTVRGYLQAEELGDRALHSTVELRSPSLFKKINWIDDMKVHAFYDIAKVFTIDPLDEEDSALISGVGFGAYLKALKHFNASLEVAWPLKDTEFTEANDYRTHMRLWYEF